LKNFETKLFNSCLNPWEHIYDVPQLKGNHKKKSAFHSCIAMKSFSRKLLSQVKHSNDTHYTWYKCSIWWQVMCQMYELLYICSYCYSNLMIQKRLFFKSSFATQKWFSSSFNDHSMDSLFQRVKWHNDQTIPYFLFVYDNNFKCIYPFTAIHTLIIPDSLIFVLFFSFQIDFDIYFIA
jgi:hypothetical protein